MRHVPGTFDRLAVPTGNLSPSVVSSHLPPWDSIGPAAFPQVVEQDRIAKRCSLQPVQRVGALRSR
jgi:hypothetical protein